MRKFEVKTLTHSDKKLFAIRNEMVYADYFRISDGYLEFYRNDEVYAMYPPNFWFKVFDADAITEGTYENAKD